MTTNPKAYLAGPDIFRSDAPRFGEDLVRRCAEIGIDGIFPINPDELPPSQVIYAEDIEMLDGCDMMIANMEPFRGPSMDVGTAFEMGYAVRAGIPIFGYSSKAREPYSQRVATTVEANGRTVDDRGMAVEDFGLTDNLMVVVPLRSLHHTFDDACRAARAWWDERP